ncbi:endonuclease/exonuclease/phosphatase family protein [Actinomyces bowdenii]|uniref:Endonuclease/exonuclease/phosphatase family protein n=1 Tax=Actinomyces bowdenii TaxID=131109 RepID=A0A3P1VB37_9ACTO|nr:endonuclease/exonuclease/phosphatase family protein [Actinomyces bowdenii]MBO3723489.1 endonuclease/exonuclease/phosphatase family protein [Actinomyces bowdenii]RRD30958.1 endonuclease/exonuclease/phosphatase family protein [Actinomyces bowdenii]
MSRARRIPRWVAPGLAALIALVALVSIRPPLTLQPFIAQAVAMRFFMAAGWGALGLLIALVAIGQRLWARRTGRTGRRAGLHAAVLAVVLVLVALTHGGILVGRGTSMGALAAMADKTGQEGITVLTLNTEREDATIQDVAGAATAARADVVVLPETTADYGDRLATALAGTGDAPFTVFSAVSPPLDPDDDTYGPGRIDPVDATTVLVSSRLGDYRQVEGPGGTGRGLVMVEPVDGTGPVIAGAHTYPPVPGYMALWRTSLTGVAAICQSPPDGLILAGDLNATRDHGPLRDLHRCASAGEQAGIGGLATWPSTTDSTLMGATIDHILVDAAAWRGIAGEVITVPRTDHRGVVVRLSAR